MLARERERGFNQAALLASAVAKGVGLRLDTHSLARVAHSERHRAGMDARARLLGIVFPAALPEIMVGIRTGVVLALITMVTSEMIARIIAVNASAPDLFG